MMKKLLLAIEKQFEQFVSIALKIYGHPVTFIIAFILVIIYLLNIDFQHQSVHDSIGNIITCFTFLIFFLVQKSVSRFSLAIQVKLNELIVSHDNASNEIVHVDHKTETELKEISQQYIADHINSNNNS